MNVIFNVIPINHNPVLLMLAWNRDGLLASDVL